MNLNTAALNAVTTLRGFALDGRMSLQQSEILLHVVSCGSSIAVDELARRTGVALPSLLRDAAALSRGLGFGRRGHVLIEVFEYAENGLRKAVRLTPRGEALRVALAQVGERAAAAA